MNINLSKLQEIVEGRGTRCAVAHGVSKSRTGLDNRTTAKGIHPVIRAALGLQWSGLSGSWSRGGGLPLGTQGLEQLLLMEMEPGEEVEPNCRDPAQRTCSGQQGVPGEGQNLGHHQLGTLRLGERADRGRRHCRVGLQVWSEDTSLSPPSYWRVHGMGSLSASIRTWKTWTVMPASVLYLVGLGTNETGRSAVDYTRSNCTSATIH